MERRRTRSVRDGECFSFVIYGCNFEKAKSGSKVEVLGFTKEGFGE